MLQQQTLRRPAKQERCRSSIVIQPIVMYVNSSEPHMSNGANAHALLFLNEFFGSRDIVDWPRSAP